MFCLPKWDLNFPPFLVLAHAQAFSRGVSHNNSGWEFCLSMRESTNACVPREGSRDERGKFWKRLKSFEIKILNKMNVKKIAVFFALLAFIELSFTVASFTGEANSNKREKRHSHCRKRERFYEVVC